MSEQIQELPAPGSIWRHYNGAVYEVLMIANDHSDAENYPVMIVYKGFANGRTWARRASEWHRSFTLEDKDEIKIYHSRY